MKPNRTSYDRALAMISSGQWRVDPEAGLIWSKLTGRPMARKPKPRYHVLMLSHPSGVGTVQVMLHRVIWEHVHGPIPDDIWINHKDGNRSNNSISNLELVTSAGNIRHAIRTGLRPACVMANQGTANHMARLTDGDVREIRLLLAQGVAQKVIGARYGVHQMTISHINTGSAWTHVA